MLNACIRCSSLFVGLVSLIQALVWAGVSIWGIAIYDCATSYPFQNKAPTNPHDKSLTYLFYVTYLRGACADSQLNYVAPSAEKSYKIMLAYSIISSIWVPTAVMLIAGTCLGARGLKAKWIYIPWIIVTLACCVLDIFASIFYGIDISNTMTARDFINFLDFPNEEVKDTLGFKDTVGLDGYTAIPGIIMTLLASRAIVLWVVNLFFLFFGIQGMCAFYKKNPPKVPEPYHKYEERMHHQFEQCKEFKKPENSINNVHKSYPELPSNHSDQMDHGRTNTAFVMDEPLRLSPVEVEVKQEKGNHMRYAEVADMEIEMEPTPQELRRTPPEIVRFQDPEEGAKVSHFNSKLERLEKLGLIVPVTKPKDSHEHEQPIDGVDKAKGVATTSDLSAPVSESESALEAEEFEEIISKPAPSAPTESRNESDSQRRVYDAYGNPTEERLTPKVSRIQKIIEDQIRNSQKDMNGYNARPFSYHQPLKPQVDSVPKKNDTVRGMDKPPIPVPDYSVRVTKKPSFRTPLPNSD